jgi:DNA-binding PadR family transcriptional regulator
MSKPQLVVLSFLKRQPMYGYKIGQIVEEMKMSVWAGI